MLAAYVSWQQNKVDFPEIQSPFFRYADAEKVERVTLARVVGVAGWNWVRGFLMRDVLIVICWLRVRTGLVLVVITFANS